MRTARTFAFTVAVTALFALPASATASTGWVAKKAPSAPYNSCEHPGFERIAEAAAAPYTNITVCAGSYEEQVQITHSVKIKAETGVTLKLPASPAKSTTSCDQALEAATHSEVQDAISICGPIRVQLTGLTVDAAWPENTCNDTLYAINVSGGATLTMSSAAITAAGAQPINGCQGGIGVQVGDSVTSPEQSATASLKKVTISGYQKNGITAEAKGTKLSLKEVAVTGIGSTSVTAQNGVQVSEGAQATIDSSQVSDDEYAPETYAATGILLYGPAAGTTINKTKVEDTGYGIYYQDSEAAAPSSPQVTIKTGEIIDSRYVAAFLVQGNATISGTLMKGGEVGIGLYQYEGQPYGFTGTGTKDTIEGMSVHAVQGYSTDTSGPPSYFTIAHSKISGNPPGADVAESVYSESPTVKIDYEHDS